MSDDDVPDAHEAKAARERAKQAAKQAEREAKEKRKAAKERAKQIERSAKERAKAEYQAAKQRKERVVHTRVPAELEDELKRLAEQRRVPLSNLIRSLLEDALRPRVSPTDPTGPLRVAVEPQPPPTPAPLPAPSIALAAVVGFQPLVLTRPTSCAGCGRHLASGTQAFFGLTDRPGTQLIACAVCAAL